MSKKINLENVKASSEGLLGTIPEEINSDTDHFTEAGKQLLKFHGIYEQHDREVRGEKIYSFMIRSKLPGGQLTAEQYIAHDQIADKFANGTLRITTRQDFQFHGILKDDLRGSIQELNETFVSTFGACGDIVRNVMACPAPSDDLQRNAIQDYALELSNALFPASNSYHQIWIDGTQMIETQPVDDPIYGKSYLPRKFKIAIAYPGDNCIDVYTNDVGLVALFDDNNNLAGFNVLAGGGMGVTHNNDQTFARLADPVGYVLPDQVLDTVKAIVGIHRDYGDRENRKHARLKYIIHDRGLDWFQQELQSRVDFTVQPVQPMPEFEVDDHMGWHEQGAALWYLGVPVENGRIIDRDDYRLRSGLRAVIEQFNLPVRLTAQQSLLLTSITDADRPAVEELLAEYGIKGIEEFSNVRRYSLACPALPTCALAITEAERALPGFIDNFEKTLADLDIPDEPINIRMTGCPNGCARPYVAEIGLVGRSLNKYTLYLGGTANGTHVGRVFLDLVHFDDIIPTLRPILAQYRDNRQANESFGVYVNRIGFEALLHSVELQSTPSIGD